MRQLHVLGVSEDGTTLLLGATARSAKASHRIRLDDRLKAAVRGQLSAPGSDRTESALPPKEIQARLRAGATPDEVAKAAGIPVARVLPYFAPVEAERERIIGEARRAIVHRHRGPDATAPLGEAVDTRLREVAGIKDETVEWTARRRPDGAWVVAVAYSARGGRRSAEWLWQPAGRSLTALDSSATRLAADATPARKRPARKAATPKAASSKAGSARPSAKKAAPKRAQPKKVKSKKVPSNRRPATKKAVVAPAARPRPAAAPKTAPVKRAAAAKKTAATSAKAAAPQPRVAAVKKAAATKAARPVAAKKVAAVKPAPARKPTVKKPATSRKSPVKKTRERAIPAPRFTLVPPPADTAPVQEPAIAPATTVVPVTEPAATPAAAAPAAAAATEATPEAPRRKPGTRVPLPSWSEVLLGVGGSSEAPDASRRGN